MGTGAEERRGTVRVDAGRERVCDDGGRGGHRRGEGGARGERGDGGEGGEGEEGEDVETGIAIGREMLDWVILLRKKLEENT